MSVSLRDIIQIPLLNVKVSYYTENGISKHSSDLHLSMFTEQGLKKFDDILNFQVCAVNKKQRVIYLKSDNSADKDRVNEFWSLLTYFGGYKVNGLYENREQVVPKSLYELHKNYFTFTDEAINHQGLFV